MSRIGRKPIQIPAGVDVKVAGPVVSVKGPLGKLDWSLSPGLGVSIADGHPVLKVQLRYVAEGQPMVTGMQRVSKPGRRVYVGIKDIPRIKNGIGVAILSTSKGLMTDQDSRRAGLGGEVLCSVW